MALRIMSRSASVGANSAASDTDLWGANTKSKPEFFRTCSLQSARLSARFEVASVDGDAVDLEGLRLGLVLGHIGADQRAFACGGDFGEVEHVRLVRRRSQVRRWRRRRRSGRGG